MGEMLPYILLFLASVFLSSVSQVMLKKAAQKEYTSHLREYLNPLVIFAYAIFFTTTLIGIVAYKVIPISMGPVLEATSYFYVTLFGVTLFGEKINTKKVAALGMIVIGILVYALWG